jgi:hypothetical protein
MEHKERLVDQAMGWEMAYAEKPYREEIARLEGQYPRVCWRYLNEIGNKNC